MKKVVKQILVGFLAIIFLIGLFLALSYLNVFILRITGSSLREWAPLLCLLTILSYIFGAFLKRLGYND